MLLRAHAASVYRVIVMINEQLSTFPLISMFHYTSSVLVLNDRRSVLTTDAVCWQDTLCSKTSGQFIKF